MVDVTWKGSPNFHPQDGISKLFITDHWMVGTLGSTDAVFRQTARKASATYGVGQTEIHQYVAEKDYPFSDGNTYANQHTISIEHEGGYLVDGQRVTPSAAVCELSAQLHADIARRHGFGKLILGVNVFPHGHWVATACPGTLDIQWIVDRANEINGQGGGVVLAGVDAGVSTPLGWNASSWTTAQIQEALIKLGYDLGSWGADDDYGEATTAAVHKLEVDQRLTVDVGIAGPEVVARLAQLVGSPVPVAKSNKLVVDGKRGTLTIKAEQRALDVDPDGDFGPVSTKAEQVRVKVRADGDRGRKTIKGVQRHVGLTGDDIDGIEGSITVHAEQRALNAGTF